MNGIWTEANQALVTRLTLKEQYLIRKQTLANEWVAAGFTIQKALDLTEPWGIAHLAWGIGRGIATLKGGEIK